MALTLEPGGGGRMAAGTVPGMSSTPAPDAPPMAAARAALAASHRRLFATIDGLGEDGVRAPSRLPGWTVGHLLTHIARNADSLTRRMVAAARDEIGDQYPGGAAGRAAEIEAGAGRPAAELVADV